MVKCCLKITCTAKVWKDVKDLAGVWTRKTADNDLREKKGNTLGWLDGRDIFLKRRALYLKIEGSTQIQKVKNIELLFTKL